MFRGASVQGIPRSVLESAWSSEPDIVLSVPDPMANEVAGLSMVTGRYRSEQFDVHNHMMCT
jgi:hypothetical protein